MSQRIFTNFATSTLASDISSSDTTLNVQPGDGALFPNPGADEYFTIVLVRVGSGGDFEYEIVNVPDRTDDTFSNLERGQEGTAALSFDSGDTVELRLTADSLRQLHDELDLDVNSIQVGGIGNEGFGTIASANGIWVDGDQVINDSGTFIGQLSSDTVTTGTIVNSAVTTGKIDNGAVTTAKIDTGAVTHSKMASNSVGQSELRTSTSSQSDTLPGAGFDTITLHSYSFFPMIGESEFLHMTATNDSTSADNPRFRLENTHDSISTTYTVRWRRITSSPPYDFGEGSVHGFVYLKIDTSGNIRGTHISEDPAWYGTTREGSPEHFFKNGVLMGRWRKRSVTAKDVLEGRASVEEYQNTPPEVEELEITPQVKLRGMNERPQPFENVEADKHVVLVDPLSDECRMLVQAVQEGDNPEELLREGYFVLDKEPLKNRKGPPIPIHRLKWRNIK